jgi:proteasome accessory factor C
MTDHQKLYRVFKLIQLLSQPPYRTVKHLASILECSPETVYRYIRLLESLGYLIDKKEGDLYFLLMDIPKGAESLVDEEEAVFLQDLLWKAPAGSPMRDRILHKLNKQFTLRPIAQSLRNLQTYDHIHALGKAIEAGLRVEIGNYFSAGGESSTRRAEPVEFQQGYTYIWVFDLDKQDYRQLKTERIGYVTILEEKIEGKHESRALDLFGWTGPQWLSVRLRLSPRAQQLLLEEFPDARPYVRSTRDGAYFDGPVRDWRGVGRFIMGLPGEIEVVAPEELRVYLREKVGRAGW